MKKKLFNLSAFLCGLFLLLCIGSTKTSAQVGPVSISGPTTVYGGSTSVYSLVPTVGSNVYVVWTVSFLDGQIISAPANSSLEGFGINTCYVTWSPNVQVAYLTVTLPRNSPIQQYTLRVQRGTGLNGADSMVVTDEKPAGTETLTTTPKSFTALVPLK